MDSFLLLTLIGWGVLVFFVVAGSIWIYSDVKEYCCSPKREDEDKKDSFNELLKSLPLVYPSKDAASDCKREDFDKFGDMLLEESRRNLQFSFDLRNQENQSNLSMTAIIITLVTAGFYLGKHLFNIVDGRVYAFFFCLLVVLFASILVSVVALLLSLSLEYRGYIAKDEKIRSIIEKYKAHDEKPFDYRSLNKEIKEYYISKNGNNAEWNNKSNRKKMFLGNFSRKCIVFASVNLLLMLATLGFYRVILNSMICGCS